MDGEEYERIQRAGAAMIELGPHRANKNHPQHPPKS